MSDVLPTCLSQAASEASLEFVKSRLPQMLRQRSTREETRELPFRILSIQPDASACGFDGEIGISLSGDGVNYVYDLVGDASVMLRLMEGYGRYDPVVDRFSHLGTVEEFMTTAASSDSAASIDVAGLYDLIILPLWRLCHDSISSPGTLERLVQACYRHLRPDGLSTLLLIEPETAQGVYASRGVLVDNLSSEAISKLGTVPPMPAHAVKAAKARAKARRVKGEGSAAAGEEETCCFSAVHGFNAHLDVRALHRSLNSPRAQATAAAAGDSKGKASSSSSSSASGAGSSSSSSNGAVDSSASDRPTFDIDVFCEPLDAAVDVTDAVAAYKIADAEFRAKSSGKGGAGAPLSLPVESMTVPGSAIASACEVLSEIFGLDAAALLSRHPEVAMGACHEVMDLSLYNVRTARSADLERGASGFPKVVGHVPLRVFHLVKRPRNMRLEAHSRNRNSQGLAAADEEDGSSLLTSPLHERLKTADSTAGSVGNGNGGGAAGSNSSSITTSSSVVSGGLFSSLSTVAYSALEVVSSVTGLGSSSSSSSVTSTMTAMSIDGADSLAAPQAQRKKWWLMDSLGDLSSSSSSSSSSSASSSSDSDDEEGNDGSGGYGCSPMKETQEYSHYWDRMPGGLRSREARYFASRDYRLFPLAIPPMPLLYCAPGHIVYEPDGTHLVRVRGPQPPQNDARSSGGGSLRTGLFKVEVEEHTEELEETTLVRGETSVTVKKTTSTATTAKGVWKEMKPVPSAKDGSSGGCGASKTDSDSGAAGAASASGVKFDPWFPHGDARGFLNAGLARWHAQRARWQSRPAGFVHPPYPPDVMDEVDDMLYDLTDTSVREMGLPGPVRLPDMVDALWDSWSPVSDDSDTDPDW